MKTLKSLERNDDFIHRHIGPSKSEIKLMLDALEFHSLDEMSSKIVPENILDLNSLKLGDPNSESSVLRNLGDLAKQNENFHTMIGMGYHDTITPSVILRNLIENPGWYTAYTPYQPEVSQGRLEMLINFQQLIMDLTGMEIANASLLDESTAAAEAMTMCMKLNKDKRLDFLVDVNCYPQTIDVLKTRAKPHGINVVIGNPWEDIKTNDKIYALLVQYPNIRGEILDLKDLIKRANEKNILVVVACDLLSLTLLTPPGEIGADIVLGNSQRFGVPLCFGGPHAAFFATKDDYKRLLPGRIIGVSKDRLGNNAYRMALQTREQHIRREKATSNICTAQALLAMVAASYAMYHGPEGLKNIAQRVNRLTHILAQGLEEIGFSIKNKYFFDTLLIESEMAESIFKRARDNHYNLRFFNDNCLSISINEKTSQNDVINLWRLFNNENSDRLKFSNFDRKIIDDKLSSIPKDFKRTSGFLTHPVFNSYHTETEMMRYLKRLEDKDIALNHSMISLGSCTMKLNAATEMRPVTWEKFSDIHPFVPVEQCQGYIKLIEELKFDLCNITGFDDISFQPNSGAQGEYTGLMVIKQYLEDNGQSKRNVCLIPSSAHGTNPASAQMAGMKVVVLKCDENGNVDLHYLKTKVDEFSETLAALMITYPSTHGVFEEQIKKICELVHKNGGQVYMDGANLNALVGLVKPVSMGIDVAHLNLHKTFCIPHGGGGPGMGPIGVKGHLCPYLPIHFSDNFRKTLKSEKNFDRSIGAVSSAAWGSPGILPISLGYTRLMGSHGLKKATQVAILNANYLAHSLSSHYKILYTGKNGLVAHECIVDLRELKNTADITEEDIAKRLIDYGFHAPTMSWPVTGTLMIEPTESESKKEIDRFCQAMISIKVEIRKIEKGEYDKKDNPIKNAPHTYGELISDEWEHAYTREEAGFPVESLRQSKYWPSVSRVNNVYGDRNLFCSCPPVEFHESAA